MKFLQNREPGIEARDIKQPQIILLLFVVSAVPGHLRGSWQQHLSLSSLHGAEPHCWGLLLTPAAV